MEVIMVVDDGDTAPRDPAVPSGGGPTPRRIQRRASWLRGHGPETLIGGTIIAVTASLVGAVVTGMFDSSGDDDKPLGQATRVLAWAEGKVKEGPIAKSKEVATVKPGNYYTGMCWTTGDKVTYGEYSNDKWVRLQLPNSRTGYVSAIFLRGNDQGGVPNEC